MSAYRQFLIPVRPLHRESLDSYTSRVLHANFEPDTLRSDLLTADGARPRDPDSDTRWQQILEAKTGRRLHLVTDPAGHEAHADGSSCPQCLGRIQNRQMCTFCSHGVDAVQHAHLAAPVCIRHQRWIGLGNYFRQEPVGADHIRAARIFTRLHGERRLDLALYTVVLHLLHSLKLPDQTTEQELFPTVMNIIATLTNRSLLAAIFNPNTSYEHSYRRLREALKAVISPVNPVASGLWLYLRSTFAALRTATIRASDYAAPSAHSFPLPAITVARYVSADAPVKPFDAYLVASGDTLESALQFELNHHRLMSPSPQAPGHWESLCEKGHTIKGGASTRCPVCHFLKRSVGENDLVSLHPQLAAELDRGANGGLDPATVLAGSNIKLWWRCAAAGHSFDATPSNRVASRKSCPICTNRRISVGVNDVATTHPEIASEWSSRSFATHPPIDFTAGSNQKIDFLCPAGHEYTARIVDRIHGDGCTPCATRAALAEGRSFTQTHPKIAAEWHPTYNRGIEPHDVTEGSRRDAFWLCANGHTYKQRIERRTKAGYGCGKCSKRTFTTGVNDLATTDPELSSEWHPWKNTLLEPSRTGAIDKLYWWRCWDGHDYEQTVDHRRKSKGCPRCDPEHRILKLAA